MRGTLTRLQKLEAKWAPKSDALFYVFGMDEDDVADRIVAETVAGTLRRGDQPHPVVWRGPAPPPAARWASHGDLSDEEMEDAVATLSIAVGREAIPRGELVDGRLAEEYMAIRALVQAELQTLGTI